MLMTEPTGLDMICDSNEAMVAWGGTVEDFLSHDKETPASLARTKIAEPSADVHSRASHGFPE